MLTTTNCNRGVCIWTKASPKCQNTAKINKCVNIKNVFVSGEECKVTFKKFRDKYVKLAKKTPPSGSSADDSQYQTTWELYWYLTFLDAVIKPRN